VRRDLDRRTPNSASSCGSWPASWRRRSCVVQRYVRVASPAQGTRLASGNLDLFLSGMLTLIGQVPFFFGSPLYSAFKRVVLEIARKRTNAHLVPGIEAMLPDSPMARLLRDAPVRSGHRDGGDRRRHRRRQSAEAPGGAADRFSALRQRRQRSRRRYRVDVSPASRRRRGHGHCSTAAPVSHFRYFTNIDTRSALRDWLVADGGAAADRFPPLPGLSISRRRRSERGCRGEGAAGRVPICRWSSSARA
jgi:hypothetical protein